MLMMSCSSFSYSNTRGVTPLLQSKLATSCEIKKNKSYHILYLIFYFKLHSANSLITI
jgi:hypothetical protein